MNSEDRDNVTQNKVEASSVEEADQLFDTTTGSKMMFLNGNLYKSNINFSEDELLYYKFIGTAYNSKVLNRATVDG
jgi:hypothetical protein